MTLTAEQCGAVVKDFLHMHIIFISCSKINTKYMGIIFECEIIFTYGGTTLLHRATF